MQKFMKTLGAMMLMVVVLCAACTKDPENGGGNTNGGNGSGGGNANGHAYVDLGLPSGTLWATCNVGADTPEGYGDYFAWGETSLKDIYVWSTYKYANSTSMYDPRLTKYCSKSSCGDNGFTDTLTILLPEDDAATANLGGDWRTPTYNEWDELIAYCTYTWTTRNGVNGRLFTAPNGNSLFLPAAGSIDVGSPSGVGYDGYYWSSSLSTSYPEYANFFYFVSDECYMNGCTRNGGLSVRAVLSASKH